MKKLLSLFILTSVLFVASVNTAVAQDVKKRAKAQLHVTKTKKLQRDVCKAHGIVHHKKKARLKAKPVRQKAQIKVQPLQRKIEKK